MTSGDDQHFPGGLGSTLIQTQITGRKENTEMGLNTIFHIDDHSNGMELEG